MNIQSKKMESQKIEYKTIAFEIKAFDDKDPEFIYFEGYAAVFGNKDFGDDVIVKGAFTESLKEIDPVLLGFHESDKPPLGLIEVKEDNHGLFVKGKMPKKDVFVSGRIAPQMEIGSIKTMSIGYKVWGGSGSEFKDGIRYLKKLVLFECSLVSVAMNPDAKISMKSINGVQNKIEIADRNQKWNFFEAIDNVKKWAGVLDGGINDPEIQAKYKQAFLWYDQDDPSSIDSYQFLIMDVVDGELTIIPRAIFETAAILQSKRFSTWIPAEDIPGLIKITAEYYGKMELPSPFKESKNFRVENLKGLDLKTMEGLLRSGVSMSRKNAKIITSLIKPALIDDDQSEEKNQRDVDNLEKINILVKSIKSIKLS